MSEKIKEYKGYIRKWSVTNIINNAISIGIGFGCNGIKEETLKKQRRVLINELNRRKRINNKLI